jgi:hypothetical protein
MSRINVAFVAMAAVLPLLAACKSMPMMADPAPSTQARIENDILATRPASNTGLAPPIEITRPTP